MESKNRVADLQFPGLDNRGQSYISPHTRVGLNVYPQRPDNNGFLENRGQGEYIFNWIHDKSHGSVINFSWSKHMGVPEGTWSATVKNKIDRLSGKPFVLFDDQDIADGDWIDLQVLRNGVVIPLARGIVDTVREQKVVMGGSTVITYAMTGRDHGAMFTYPITYADIYAQTLGELVTGLFTRRIGGKVGGTPDELFKLLIDGALSKGREAGQWEVPPALAEIYEEKQFHDLLKVITFSAEQYGDHLRGAYFNEIQLWATGGETLHQALTRWTNPILNEIWYDLLPPSTFMPAHGLGAFLKAKDIEQGKVLTDPTQTKFSSEGVGIGAETKKGNEFKTNQYFGSMAAFIRERPFISSVSDYDSMWFYLPTWVIPSWLIQNSDLGRGGDQRVNLVQLMADFGLGPQQEQITISPPKWNKEDIKRRGLRTMQQRTQFHSQDAGNLGALFREDRQKWQQLLVDWYAPAPYLRQGSIILKVMLPEIRIGHRLIIVPNDNPAQAEQFYIEGVQHDFSTSIDGITPIETRTVLILTRGFRGSDDELYKATMSLSGQFTGVR